MIAAPRIFASLLVLVAALVQVSIASRIEIGSATPSLLTLVVAAVALLSGSVPGACYGFLAGIALACFAALPLGPHALVYVLVGYAVGRVGEAIVSDDHPAPPLICGIVATFVVQVGRPLVEFLVNPAVGSVAGLWTHSVLVTALSAVLAVPVYLGVRRVLAWANRLAGIHATSERGAAT
ncbi:MAG: rod shape-determining protein MreD [Thermoleophilia bacterium]|jgi:rod shape-determining protein MreD|nr:rod shape-determining protein MreD [Thermoleophilia bacterium]